jgi:hypothetical protein
VAVTETRCAPRHSGQPNQFIGAEKLEEERHPPGLARRVQAREYPVAVGVRWLGGLDRQLRALLLSPIMTHKLRSFISRENLADITALTELIEAGKVTPVVDRACPLSETPKAIRYMEEGHARGKVVITVAAAH